MSERTPENSGRTLGQLERTLDQLERTLDQLERLRLDPEWDTVYGYRDPVREERRKEKTRREREA